MKTEREYCICTAKSGMYIACIYVIKVYLKESMLHVARYDISTLVVSNDTICCGVVSLYMLYVQILE